MKHVQLRFGKGFHVVFGNGRAQVAEMVIEPGGREGDPSNRHHGADQWLYVVSGAGVASVNGKTVPLRAGVLILIEKNDRHEIKNTGRECLRTLNYYTPPAYTDGGDELPTARRR